MNDLKPGTYRLTAPVTNPCPDRRANQDRLTSYEHWAVWPKGLTFLLKERPAEDQGTGRLATPTLYLVARGGIKDLFPWDDAYPLLVAALEPVIECPSDLVRRLEGSMAGGYALEILDRLLTTRAVQDALSAIHAAETTE